ncbi:PREDICTED: polycomb group protein EMBRYONIC FLOWER 2-like [Lupinus angustifolius]|uniref:polycomb group protein EMBRYONIC FLOWER 2-like n=1 Tax=Lupinus angustifolius TaxID=3871 RepID=UPI00092FB837|nr:PREDICTED: polycomb group protein EMBRYONIC FLOWER 2-like [Lupinus angustifolius]
MLGLDFEVGESSNSRSTTQTSNPSSPSSVHFSEEDMLAPKESFTIYCQLMELYNFLMHRAKENPTFLNRCLDYRIKAKHKRIKMKVSMSLRIDETENVLPLYICLARQTPNNRNAEYCADYRISRIFKFEDFPEIDGDAEVQAKFKLPEVNKLAEEAKSGSLYLMVFTTVKNRNSSSEANRNPIPSDECEIYFYFVSGQGAEIVMSIDLIPCYLKCVEKDQSISVQAPYKSYYETTIKKLQILVSAEEYGSKERSPYFTYSSRDILSPSLARLIRLRERNVLFNYRYCHNSLRKTEVTADFACPLCLVRCGSYKGVRYHMHSSHDLFDFEFTVDQTVNVSIKADVFEIVGDVNPRQETFMLRAKPFKRRNLAAMREIPRNLSFENSNNADLTDPESECLVQDRVDEFSDKGDGMLQVEPSHEIPIVQHVPNKEKLQVKSDYKTDVKEQVVEKRMFPTKPGNETHGVQQFAEKSKVAIETSHGTPVMQDLPNNRKLLVNETQNVQQFSEKRNLTSEPAHETQVAKQVEKKGNLLVESNYDTIAMQQVANKENLPIETSHENEQQVTKKGNLLVESHHVTLEVQQVAKKVKLSPEEQHVAKKRKSLVEPSHGTSANQHVPNKEMLPGEPSFKTSTMQQVSKKGRLLIGPDPKTLVAQHVAKKVKSLAKLRDGTPIVQVDKKRRLPIKLSHGTLQGQGQHVPNKEMLEGEPSHETPMVQEVIEPTQDIPIVKQVSKQGKKLHVESNHETLVVPHIVKKGKSPIEPSNGTRIVQKVAKKGMLRGVPDNVDPDMQQHVPKRVELPIEGVNETLAVQKVTKKAKLSDKSIDEAPPIQLVFEEGKLPVENSHPQSNSLLCRRQFYHSTKYQPMSLEEVLSSQDNEDEIDDDTKDIEHLKLIDEYEVTKDEKEIIFMWSSFVRRQRVVADCHIPWACEAFAKLHAPLLVKSPQLALCWRLLLIKLWNHNLIDGKVMNTCSIILEEYHNLIDGKIFTSHTQA